VGVLDSQGNRLILDLTFDWRLLGFTAFVAALTCILSGLAAAWRAGGISASTILHSGRGLTDSRTRVTLRQTLVVAQVALSLVLLTGARVFARSLHNLTRQEIGFKPDGLTIAYVDASGMNVPVEKRAEFKRSMIDRLASTPGVVSVGETSVIPLSGSASGNDVWLDTGSDTPKIGDPGRAASNFADVDGKFFETIGIALTAGRTFDDRDTASAPPVVIVNEAFVREFVKDGSSPVGRRLWRERSPARPQSVYEIVGVVGDAKYRDLRDPLEPVVYTAIAQRPRPSTFSAFLVRTSNAALPPGAVLPALKGAFRLAGPAIVPTFGDYREMIEQSLVQDRLLAALSAFFGVLAVLLATLGLYGSVSFAVSRRTAEIGLRMALGADRLGIVRMVLSEAFVLVLVGCIAGGALALTLARALGTMAYGLAPNDPLTLAAACVFLTVVALAASAAPARRAARLDPMVAVRIQ
jgi:predicted permease